MGGILVEIPCFNVGAALMAVNSSSWQALSLQCVSQSMVLATANSETHAIWHHRL